MASSFTHAFSAVVLGKVLKDKYRSKKIWILGILCSVSPDIDILFDKLGWVDIPMLAMRGFSHSIFFAMGLATLFTLVFHLKEERNYVFWIYYTLCGLLHSAIDALSKGLGVAILSPLEEEHFHLPYKVIDPLPVSFDDQWYQLCLQALKSEFLWIIIPGLVVFGFLHVLNKSSSILSLLIGLFKIVALITLPFIILIRGSVFLHLNFGQPPLMSILGGSIITAILLVIYFSFVTIKFKGRLGGGKALKRRGIFALVLVLVYIMNGLMFVSSKNLKHNDLASEYKVLHPILRLATATLIHLDRKLLITDAQRVPSDYEKMGLEAKKHSNHYVQSDGYVHALDIRTNYRPEWQNSLISFYFNTMGLKTLRHVGTADHLHISLPRS